MRIILSALSVSESAISFTLSNIGTDQYSELEISWEGTPNGSATLDSATTAYTINSLNNNSDYDTTIAARDSSGNTADTYRLYLRTREAGDPAIVYTPISTAGELDNLRNNLNGSFLLMADIDLSGYQSGAGWEPIGTATDDTTKFTGNLNGNGFTISNLFINRPAGDYQGLFGYTGVYGAFLVILQNIKLENVLVAGGDDVGSLGGMTYSSRISHCSVTGNVSGNARVGGLIGYVNGTVLYSSAQSQVDGSGSVGGLVGYCHGGIFYSHSSGSATGTTGSTGGLLGENASGSIIECSSSSSVASSYGVGGLIGTIRGYIYESFSTGTVTGTGVAPANKMVLPIVLRKMPVFFKGMAPVLEWGAFQCV